ncbi:cystine transporter subunit [Pseudodesulfovibrio hydrargyri]|uniref:Cystine transporter subunit n=1 Tax=Pseudodesulfovibrio hydrargyri TaxID=2125990 RepID=A0A1J5MRK5_9BACT|nr:transporter substrate-binding domain-containing protein [Pseudodesulfovibrio hydrargyri]OIQ49230.1 cystine transporter subunit [Pseudodesulfovibrio hydrargyri]
MENGCARFGGALLAAALVISLAAGTARARGPVLEVAAYLLPPASHLDENGVLRGETVEWMGRLLADMGYTPKFRVLPFRRCLEAMRDGAVPMMLPCVVSIERQAFMRFSDPVEYMHTVLWKKGRDPAGCWETLDDLAGLRIGVIEGYYYGSKWQEALAAGTFRVEGSIGRDPNRANFRMLREGRVDMVVCDRSLGRFLQRQDAPLFDDMIPCPGEIGESTPLCAPVSLKYFKDHGLSPDEFLSRFNALLRNRSGF